jgi:short-subunit dehydrogenase
MAQRRADPIHILERVDHAWLLSGVYSASKSFVQSFALALRNELTDTEVSVTSLMPGPTETEFFERADMLDTKIGAGAKDDSADVARAGFEALMAGDERVVAASLSTKLQGRGSRLLPDGVKAEMHRRMAEPGSAKPSAVARGRG